MKIKFVSLMAIFTAALLVPQMSLAQVVAKQKVFSGTVNKVYANQITFRTTSAGVYAAETGQATLVRKNGAAMTFGEILVGDKVEVRGMLWPDGSMNATYVRNMSLYPHTSTFTGKIAGINPLNSSLTLQSKQYGTQVIHTDAFTTFKNNSKSVTLADLILGTSATIKGTWDRDNADITAKSVQATVRYVNVDVTGALVLKGGNGLTITGNNVMYGIDISGAKLQNKSGKTIPLSRINPGDTLRVQGKHISESTQIIANVIKDLSISQ